MRGKEGWGEPHAREGRLGGGPLVASVGRGAPLQGQYPMRDKQVADANLHLIGLTLTLISMLTFI